LHNLAPDLPNFDWIRNAQSIKQHLIIGNAGRNTQNGALKLRTQAIDTARNSLKQLQRFLKTTLEEQGKSVEINDIMENRYIAFIAKTQGRINLKRFLCPAEIRIAKSIVRNSNLLEDRYGFLGLAVLLIPAQSAVIVMYIAMHADFSTIA